LTSNGVTVDVGFNGVNYSFPDAQVSQINLQSLGGNDQISQSPATASDRIIPGVIDLGSGDDTFMLAGGIASAPLDVLGGDGNDSAISTTAANALVRFNPGAGSDTVTIEGAAEDQTYTVNLTSTVVVQGLRFNFQAAENVEIQDIQGSNTFNVMFLLAALNLKITSVAGNDTFDLSASAPTANITIFSGAGTDSLHLAASLVGSVNYLDSTSGDLP